MAARSNYIPVADPLFAPRAAGKPRAPVAAPSPVAYPEGFGSFTPEEKYRFFRELATTTADKPFGSDEAAETYRRRVRRWFDVVELREPDRVPSFLLCWGYAASYGGASQAETFYDAAKTAEATLRFHADFEPDYATRVPAMPGRMFERLGIRMMRWPGGGRPDALGDDTPFQYVEGEYMRADEYEELIRDPEGFLLRAWYPRVFENLKGLAGMPTFANGVEPTGLPGLLLPLALGPLRQAIDTLLAAADSCLADTLPVLLGMAEIQRRWGAPNLLGGFALAPFDIIGDTLRGTRAVMLDMHRRPEALIAACDAVTPAAIRMGVEGAMATGQPFVIIPLHKGDDTFMSEAQFARFYWPSFKRQLEGIIAAGLVPLPFVEGAYTKKLDVIAGSDLPKGKVAWLFDRTDMRAAKEKLGGKACIGGNVPASLFMAGGADEMDGYCRRLIEQAAPGGGFFLAPGAVIDHATPEALRAFLQTTRKYGVY
ncbi:MAG: hypothetical protein HY900_09440 [Deltaproteobacteria bacterium]|nr:hypothetical protein [Deltaproteobacteria bacterium]